MNAERRSARAPAGLVPVVAGADGPAWRDAVNRVLGAWALSGIDGAGLWEAIMPEAPRAVEVTAEGKAGHPLATRGLPSVVGGPDAARQT